MVRVSTSNPKSPCTIPLPEPDAPALAHRAQVLLIHALIQAFGPGSPTEKRLSRGERFVLIVIDPPKSARARNASKKYYVG
jgi:hypothetical protein